MSERLPETGDDASVDDLERGVEDLVRSAHERAGELAGREGRLHEQEQLLDAQRRNVERLEERAKVAATEAAERARALDERERQLDVREAQLNAETELRLEKLEHSEAFVAELQRRLEAREGEFASRVGQLQHELRRRDVAAVAAARTALPPEVRQAASA